MRMDLRAWHYRLKRASGIPRHLYYKLGGLIFSMFERDELSEQSFSPDITATSEEVQTIEYLGPRHQALDAAFRQFRLVRLLPKHEGLIALELRTFSLDDDIEWKALSYQWGRDEANATVILDTRPLHIRPNLYEFLVQMDKEEERAWFFVDAICINQDDLVERASQVSLMREIYSRAEQVVAWIPEHEGVRDLLWLSDTAPVEVDELNEDLRKWKGIQDGERHEMICMMERNAKLLSDLTQGLPENEYWSRLWIVQEVLLAKNLTVRVGQVAFSPMQVLWVLRFGSGDITDPLSDEYQLTAILGENHDISLAGGFARSYRDNAVMLLNMYQIYSCTIREGHLLPAHKAMLLYSKLGCQNSLDKVFALLGIMQSRIVPNYFMSTMELFAAACTDSLMSSGFLGHMSETPSRERDWDYDLKITLTSIHQDFKLSPLNAVAFLITSRVLRFFASDMNDANIEQWPVHNRLIWYWDWAEAVIMPLREKLNRAPRLFRSVYSKRWYESIDRFDSRAFDQSCKSVEEITRYLQPYKDNDLPLTASGPERETRKYSEWIAMADLTCETIQARAEEEAKAIEHIQDPVRRERFLNEVYRIMTPSRLFTAREGYCQELRDEVADKLIDATDADFTWDTDSGHDQDSQQVLGSV